MKKILHIVTQPEDAVARTVITAQQADANNRVTVVNWIDQEPDLDQLLDRIFAADSIAMW